MELGWQVRNGAHGLRSVRLTLNFADTQKLAFDNTLIFGYSNSHMGYFATPNEYDIGGYGTDTFSLKHSFFSPPPATSLS